MLLDKSADSSLYRHVQKHKQHQLVRKGEAEWKASGLGSDSSEAELVTAMARFPKLIERPVVFSGTKARIGRPPESVLEILDRS